MRNRLFFFAILAASIFSIAACGSDDDDSGSAGAAGTSAGSSGSSGTSGSAGESGTGGSAGSAGDAGSGGDSGSAGDAGAGGTAGSAGGAGSGGDSGSGGDAGSAGSGGGSNNGRWLMAYYPGYQNGDLPAANVRFDLLTHLAVGAVLPNNNGTFAKHYYLDDVSGEAFAKELIDGAHTAGKKAMLMVGGAGTYDGFKASSAAATRATFIQNLVSYAQEMGYDGLDLDWEPLPESDLDNFIALTSGLRTAWPSAILTVPVTPININYEVVSAKFAQAAQHLDQINLMTYSMAGAYDGWSSWHHTPLEGETGATPTSIKSTVDAFLGAGVPAAKLGIGEGFYGLCYTSPVKAPNQPLNGATANSDDNTLSYRSIMTTYFPKGTRHWDDKAKAPYLTFDAPTGPHNCTYLSYTDEESIAAHTDYVKEKGLGGAIVWTINEGHLPSKPANERDPLLEALWNGLK